VETRKKNRLEAYDYSGAGYYFVTICAKEKRPIFGSVVGATCGRPPHTELSRCGEIVEREIAVMDRTYPHVGVEKYVIMPNHVHLLLRIEPGDGRPQVAPTVSRVLQQFKGSTTKKAGIPLWQKGFYDHVVRDENDFLRSWNYIDGNPSRWTEDACFCE